MDEWRGLPEDVRSLVHGVFGNAQRLQAMIEVVDDAKDLLVQVRAVEGDGGERSLVQEGTHSVLPGEGLLSASLLFSLHLRKVFGRSCPAG
jgi:hypothetical protein